MGTKLEGFGKKSQENTTPEGKIRKKWRKIRYMKEKSPDYTREHARQGTVFRNQMDEIYFCWGQGVQWRRSYLKNLLYSGGKADLHIKEEKFFLYDSEQFFGKGGGEEYIRDLGKVIFLSSVRAGRGSFPFMLEVFWYYFPFQNTLFISCSQFLMCQNLNFCIRSLFNISYNNFNIVFIIVIYCCDKIINF